MQKKSCFRALTIDLSAFLRGYVFFILLLLSAYPDLSYAVTHWQTLAQGLEYTVLTPNPQNPKARLHAFKLDLNKYQLQIASPDNTHSNPTFVDQLASSHHALIAINGGFFTPFLKPLGLRISDHHTLNPAKNVTWWSVFKIQQHKASITPLAQFHPSSATEFAIQSGPRLLINKHIPTTLKNGESQRSALAIDAGGRVLIVITDNLYLTTNELATILRAPLSANGLNAVNALNLDGGTSSQIYANIDNFNLHLRSFRGVADAVIVIPRS